MSGTGTTRTARLDAAIAASKRSAAFGLDLPPDADGEPGSNEGEHLSPSEFSGESTFGNIFDLDNYSDAISDVGDAISDSPVIQGIGKVMKAVAPFVAMIPGVGTIVGTAMYAVGSIAAHDRLDDVAIGTIRSALPSQYVKSYDSAVDFGYKVGRGGNVPDATLSLARDYAKSEGGDEGVAVFDMAVTIGKGRGLQDAGFKLLGAWVQGSDAGERAVRFAEDLTNAAQNGKPIADFLRDEAVAQFVLSVPALQQAFYLQKAIRYFLDHPEVLLDYVEQTAEETAEDFAKRNMPSTDHPKPTFPKIVVDWFDAAEAAGVPVEAIRAAIICIVRLASGDLVVDHHNASVFDPSFTEEGDLDDPAHVAQNDVFAKTGQALAALNPEILAARHQDQGALWLYGFDVGTAVSNGHTQAGPGQDAVRDSMKKAKQAGFMASRAVVYALTLQGHALITLDDTQKLGYKIAVLNPPVANLRNTGSGAMWSLRGFDIGTSISAGKSLPGPGQDMVYRALTDAERVSYDVARKQQYDFTNKRIPMVLFVERGRITDAATTGKTLAAQYEIIKNKRESETSEEFRFGFDVATGTCKGFSLPGPGQVMVRDLIGPKTVGGSPDGRGFGSDAAQRGFDVGQTLQFEITKAGGYPALPLMSQPLIIVPATSPRVPSPDPAQAPPLPTESHGLLFRILHFFW